MEASTENYCQDEARVLLISPAFHFLSFISFKHISNITQTNSSCDQQWTSDVGLETFSIPSVSLRSSVAEMHIDNHRSVLAEFSLCVCSCKCSGSLCEACCDLILFGLISPETCLRSLPTLPFASHDHGSGQLLNAGVSSLQLSMAAPLHLTLLRHEKAASGECYICSLWIQDTSY